MMKNLMVLSTSVRSTFLLSTFVLSTFLLCACGAESRNGGSGSGAGGDDGADDSDGAGGEDAGSDAGGEGVDGGGGGGDDGDPDGDECWQAATFVDLSELLGGAGEDYPDVELSAECVGEELVVKSNGMIPYEFQEMTPNPLSEQDYTWHIPLVPEPLDEPVDIPLLGTAGIAVNGLPLYGPNEGEHPHPYGDPVFNQLMDICGGHTAQRGDYHYHQLLVECLASQAGAEDGDASPVIGWALDGYPIYGSWGCLDDDCDEPVKFTSGWEVTGDPTTYAWDNHEYRPSESATTLDKCNGRVGPDGSYRYHATDGFPYILGCYHGRAEGAGGGGPGGGPGGGDGGGPGGGPGGGDDGGGGPGGGPGGDGPPQEAIDACADKDLGDDCEFDGRRGAARGECVERPDGGGLACLPEGGARPPR